LKSAVRKNATTQVRRLEPKARAVRAVRSAQRAAPAAAPAGVLTLARVVAVERGEGSAPPSVTVRLGPADGGTGRTVDAAVDGAVDVEVLETARDRGEIILVVDGVRPTVVGALRTRATPGVDAVDHVAIRARTFEIDAERAELRAAKVHITADEEISLRASSASIVVRAAGEIESFAERIVARAEGVHKLIGRMLRLN
jgi:hypothetical protein